MQFVNSRNTAGILFLCLSYCFYAIGHSAFCLLESGLVDLALKLLRFEFGLANFLSDHTDTRY